MLEGWKPIKYAMGYVVSNKQHWQQFRKIGSTQNNITALILPTGIKMLNFMTLTGPATSVCVRELKGLGLYPARDQVSPGAVLAAEHSDSGVRHTDAYSDGMC